MHPAYSVIVFTTASGAGYGLLFWLGIWYGVGLLSSNGLLPLVAIGVSLVLITVGLLASTLHLGHPERAIGAFSQWRSSWLSREGVAAVATYVPAGLLAVFWLFDVDTRAIPLLAILSALGAAVTVYCTGMIYASLRTIRQWNLPLVPVIYLVLAAASGGLLWGWLVAVFGQMTSGTTWIALICLGAAGILKMRYWRTIDNDAGAYTAEMALGLKALGPVRVLEPPHTAPNFVMREMGYQVARSHARTLRRGVIIALFVVPSACVLLAHVTDWAVLFFGLSVVSAAIGLVVERWLFFAEARHVSQLYYGTPRA